MPKQKHKQKQNRERTTTNGYIDPNDSIINYSFGVLEQGVPITPNKL